MESELVHEADEGDLLRMLMAPENDRAWKLAVGITLKRVEDQARRTNGRVNKLERFAWAAGGGLVVVGAVAVPLFIRLVSGGIG